MFQQSEPISKTQPTRTSRSHQLRSVQRSERFTWRRERRVGQLSARFWKTVSGLCALLLESVEVGMGKRVLAVDAYNVSGRQR